MLGKLKQIFISYGARQHTPTDFVIESIIAEVQKLRDEGYRLEHRLIDASYWISENGEIPSTVVNLMDRADGAIIILTPSDVGGAVDLDAGEPRLQPRARQNVIHEYGFLQARLAHRNIKVFADTSVEIPSNLISFARVLLPLSALDNPTRDPSEGAINRKDLKKQIGIHTRTLATQTIQVTLAKTPPFLAPNWPINLTDFVQSKVSARDADIATEWGELFEELDAPLDRLLALYERIVFDPYLYPLDIWSAVMEGLTLDLAQDEASLEILKGLHHVRDYQEGAAKERMTAKIGHYVLVGAKLDGMMSGLTRAISYADQFATLAPIVHVVLHDYLGLCQLRRAKEIDRARISWWRIGSKLRKRKLVAEWLERAIESLERVAAIASDHENHSHPVWLGFSLFNLARAQQQRWDLGLGIEADWRRTLDNAIGRREKLSTTATNIPERIHMGFTAEYVHACVHKANSLPHKEAQQVLEECRPSYEILRQWRGPRFPLRTEVEQAFQNALSSQA